MANNPEDAKDNFDDYEVPDLIEKNYSPGEMIIKEGETGELAYKIVAGKVEVTKGTGDDEVRLAELEKNEVFGEMTLIDNKPHSASVKAVDYVECICIPKNAFEKELELSSPIIQDIVRAFSSRLRDADDRICSAISKPI